MRKPEIAYVAVMFAKRKLGLSLPPKETDEGWPAFHAAAREEIARLRTVDD